MLSALSHPYICRFYGLAVAKSAAGMRRSASFGAASSIACALAASAHVHTAGPRYRIDYAWLCNPAAAYGRRLVPLSTRVEHDCGGASDHQPIVIDFEAIAFDAGE